LERDFGEITEILPLMVVEIRGEFGNYWDFVSYESGNWTGTLGK
jgi:hypothetical protein